MNRDQKPGKRPAVARPADRIPFNKPTLTGAELEFIQDAVSRGQLSAAGYFTGLCQETIESMLGIEKAFLTSSGSAALEMAALIAGVKEGDEVIMPSFTYVTTASSFVLHGATPVFVDIDPDTLNIDPVQVRSALTKRTRAIVPVHYAGVGCDMDSLMEIASSSAVTIIEDAAHAILAQYNDKSLGSFGSLSILSFHETKNVITGEGGALVVNDLDLIERAQMIWDKGTDRHRFLEGQVDKYTWQVLGASFAPGELIAAFLLAQLKSARSITDTRLSSWQRYYRGLEKLEVEGMVLRPVQLSDRCHNGHIFYLLVPSESTRRELIAYLDREGIKAVFHYAPLHLSPAGRKYCRVAGSLENTEHLSSTIVRLPLWNGILDDYVDYVIDRIYQFFSRA